MIRLILRIEEEEQGVVIYDETERCGPVASEVQKFGMIMGAIREAFLAEAKRLSDLACGKSVIGSEAEKKLHLRPEDSPETLKHR